MLALKQGLSLVSTPKLRKWSPDDETSLVAWYQNRVGIVLNGSDVERWEDSAPDGLYDMVQAVEGQQPAYSAGALSFVSSARDYLQTSAQISLTGAFTIGIRIFPDITTTGTFIGDNTDSGEKFKINGTATLLITIGGSHKTIVLNGSEEFGDDYLVITRNGSDLISLWRNGIVQTQTKTLAGTSEIDSISVRYSGVDNFDGTIEEIQIYSSTSADLTANINDRLKDL